MGSATLVGAHCKFSISLFAHHLQDPKSPILRQPLGNIERDPRLFRCHPGYQRGTVDSEPRDVYPLNRGATILALSGVMLGMFLATLNQTAIVTALPRMVSELGGGGDYFWVFTAYMLASTATVPIWGRLSDIHGRRRLFLIAIIIFQVGALVAITAGSMTQLVVARLIQGLGGGALIGLAFATAADLIPPSDRGRWQGLIGAVAGAAVLLGPATGGWIVDHTTWRWIFAPTLPLGTLALVLTTSYLEITPRSDSRQSVDYAGAALLMVGLAAGMLALVSGGKSSPWASFQIVMLLVGLVFLTIFSWHVSHASDPIIPFQLLGQRVFRAASAAIFLTGAGMFSTLMFVPLFVQGAQANSATRAGMVVGPMLLAMMVTSILSGQFVARRGHYRGVLLTGPLLMMAGMGLLLTLDIHSAGSETTMATIVIGLGLGMLSQNLVLVMQNAASPGYLGVTTGSAQFFRGLGGTVGVTVLGAMMTNRLGAPSTVRGALSQLSDPSLETREAIANAIHPLFAIGLALMGAALVATLLIPHTPLRRHL